MARTPSLLFYLLLVAIVSPAGGSAQSACPSLSNKPSDTNHAFSFSSYTFSTATVSDFNTGYAILDATVSVSGGTSGGSNTVCIRTASTNLGVDGNGSKPLADLLWSADGGTTWYAITGSFMEIPGAQWVGCCNTVSLKFKMLLSWAVDIPATYFGDLQFRAGRVQ